MLDPPVAPILKAELGGRPVGRGAHLMRATKWWRGGAPSDSDRSIQDSGGARMAYTFRGETAE
jgi:hypothetical protein